MGLRRADPILAGVKALQLHAATHRATISAQICMAVAKRNKGWLWRFWEKTLGRSNFYKKFKKKNFSASARGYDGRMPPPVSSARILAEALSGHLARGRPAWQGNF
jgi:hypothetical protein